MTLQYSLVDWSEVRINFPILYYVEINVLTLHCIRSELTFMSA